MKNRSGENLRGQAPVRARHSCFENDPFMHRRRFVLAALSAAGVTLRARAAPADPPVHFDIVYPRIRPARDVHAAFALAVLDLAMKTANASYTLRSADIEMERGRALAELAGTNNMINLHWTSMEAQAERGRNVVRIPIHRGLIGRRLFIIRKEDSRRVLDELTGSKSGNPDIKPCAASPFTWKGGASRATKTSIQSQTAIRKRSEQISPHRRVQDHSSRPTNTCTWTLTVEAADFRPTGAAVRPRHGAQDAHGRSARQSEGTGPARGGLSRGAGSPAAGHARRGKHFFGGPMPDRSSRRSIGRRVTGRVNCSC